MKRQTNIRLDEELIEGLQALKDRYGTPAAEAVRRALRMWLEAQGVKVKPVTAQKVRPVRAKKGGTQKRTRRT